METAAQQAFSCYDATPPNQARFAAWADCSGLPAATIFFGIAPSGLPLSLQLIEPRGADRRAIEFGAALEGAFGPPRWPPGYR